MAGGGKVKIKGGVASHNEVLVTDGAVHVTLEGGGGSTTNHNLLLNNPAPNDDHTQYYHIDGRRALTGDMDAGTFDVENVERLRVGGTATYGSTAIRQGAIQAIHGSASGVALTIGDVVTDATNKFPRIVALNYTTAGQPITVLMHQSTVASNILSVGGGSAVLDAITQGRLYASAAVGTATGTEMVRWSQAGVRIEAGVTAAANYLLHVVSGASGGTASASADELVVEGSGSVGISILSGAANSGNLFFGDSGATGLGRVAYDHSTNTMSLWASNSEQIRVTTSRVRIEDSVAADPDATLHVVQKGAASAIPCLELEQDDVDREFIEFDGNSATGVATSITTWTTGQLIQGHIQVTINGVKRWIPFFDDPTGA